MRKHRRPLEASGDGVVELARFQPIEAEVMVAKLRASGIAATMGAESVYPSLVVASGVAIFVPADDALRATAILEGDEEPE